MPEAPPPSPLLQHGPREHTPCYSFMPTLDGLVTADLCPTGTPVAWVTSLYSQTPGSHLRLLCLEPQHSMDQERCPPAFFLKGTAWTTGGVLMPQASLQRASFLFLYVAALIFFQNMEKCYRNWAKNAYKHWGYREILFLSPCNAMAEISTRNLGGHALLR